MCVSFSITRGISPKELHVVDVLQAREGACSTPTMCYFFGLLPRVIVNETHINLEKTSSVLSLILINQWYTPKIFFIKKLTNSKIY